MGPEPPPPATISPWGVKPCKVLFELPGATLEPRCLLARAVLRARSRGKPAVASTEEPGPTRHRLAARTPDLVLELGVGRGREDVDELGEGYLVVA